jgi:hypothetical protein
MKILVPMVVLLYDISPFARLITHLNINLSSDDAPSGDETSEKTTFEMLKE